MAIDKLKPTFTITRGFVSSYRFRKRARDMYVLFFQNQPIELLLPTLKNKKSLELFDEFRLFRWQTRVLFHETALCEYDSFIPMKIDEN